MISLFYNYDNDITVKESRAGTPSDECYTNESGTSLLRNIKGDILGIRNTAGSATEAYFSVEAPEISKLWDFATFKCVLTDKADETVFTFDVDKYYPGILKLYIPEHLPKGVYHIKLYMDIPHECEYTAIIDLNTIDLSVDLDFSKGDLKYVRPLANQSFKTVDIKCPEELKPENIVKGVTIAGVTGIFEPVIHKHYKKRRKKHKYPQGVIPPIQEQDPLDPSFTVDPEEPPVNFIETDLIRVEGITAGCEAIIDIDNSITLTIKNTELNLDKADPSIGRVVDGWWAGIKVIIKDGSDLEKVQYTSGLTNHILKPFVNYRDTENSIGLWGCINDDTLEMLSEEVQCLRYYWFFDIDGDGIFENKIVLRLEIPSIRLIGHDPEYITFEDEDDEIEDQEPEQEPELPQIPSGPILDKEPLDPGFSYNPNNTEEIPEQKVKIIYCDEVNEDAKNPEIDTYLIFAGNGALLSVE